MLNNTIETDPQIAEEPTDPLTGNQQFQVLVDELGLQNALIVMSLTKTTDSRAAGGFAKLGK